MKPGWKFRDEYISQLSSPKDTVYIEDRHKLEKFKGLNHTDTSVTISYTEKSGNKFKIRLCAGKFNKKRHKLHLADTVYKFIDNEKRFDYLVTKNLIDEKQAYGIDMGVPRTEIKSLKIIWNEKELLVPKTAFSNLFEAHVYSVEVYFAQKKDFIYLYMDGSDGAGSYSVKFVFNKSGYVTRIVTTNECAKGYDFLDALPKDCE